MIGGNEHCRSLPAMASQRMQDADAVNLRHHIVCHQAGRPHHERIGKQRLARGMGSNVITFCLKKELDGASDTRIVLDERDDGTGCFERCKMCVHDGPDRPAIEEPRSEEHTSELQSLMRISYAVFCLKKKKKQ